MNKTLRILAQKFNPQAFMKTTTAIQTDKIYVRNLKDKEVKEQNL